MTPSTLELRPATGEDAHFLRGLFAEGRAELFAAMPVGQEQLAALVQLQFDAQASGYRATYPRSVDHVILLGSAPAGRIWLEEDAESIHILDLVVARSHRRQGVARSMLLAIIDQADRSGRTVRLSVWHANDAALALYRSLGFRMQDTGNGYLACEHACRAGAAG